MALPIVYDANMAFPTDGPPIPDAATIRSTRHPLHWRVRVARSNPPQHWRSRNYLLPLRRLL